MCGQNCARALSFTDRCVHGVQTRMRQQPPWNCVLHLTRKSRLVFPQFVLSLVLQNFIIIFCYFYVMNRVGNHLFRVSITYPFPPQKRSVIGLFRVKDGCKGHILKRELGENLKTFTEGIIDYFS